MEGIGIYRIWAELNERPLSGSIPQPVKGDILRRKAVVPGVVAQRAFGRPASASDAEIPRKFRCRDSSLF